MSIKLEEIKFNDKNGDSKSIKDFKAKLYLIVNVASKCGLTPHYKGLQEIYAKYASKGLEILAFPANEFLAQEPGSNDEIQEFCSLTYNVTFPVNQKIIVKGDGQHDLYKALTQLKPTSVKNSDGSFEKLLTDKNLISGGPSDIKWNFEKFLVNQSGEVIERFFPDIEATDSRIISLIEKHLL